MSACCNESGCRRKRPMILTRSGLSGTWYVVTDYIDRDGSIVAKTKHRLSDQQQGELEEMFNVGRGDSSLDDNH